MKKLGQHFLKNPSALRKIVRAAEIKPGNTVVEVGPGHGELTRFLLAANPKKMILVEKDGRFIEKLKGKFKTEPVEVIEGDILKILPSLTQKSGKYKLVGNIPYYLTGRLLRIAGELENKPELIVFTIQKEVAERIAAQPPKMNLLAASVQFWAKPEIISTIGKSNFSPPPKVESAIIRLTPFDQLGIDPDKYYKLIKVVFKQPRKTILNNLSASIKIPITDLREVISGLKIYGNSRPQELSVEKLKGLTDVMSLQ